MNKSDLIRELIAKRDSHENYVETDLKAGFNELSDSEKKFSEEMIDVYTDYIDFLDETIEDIKDDQNYDYEEYERLLDKANLSFDKDYLTVIKKYPVQYARAKKNYGKVLAEMERNVANHR